MLHPHHTNKNTAVRLMIGGRIFGHADLSDASQSKALQHSLDAARQKFGHALCLCRRTPLKLQVRLRDGRYHLAVWPQEGPLHDAECIFFRDDLQLDAASDMGVPPQEPPSVVVGMPAVDNDPPMRRQLNVFWPWHNRKKGEDAPALLQAQTDASLASEHSDKPSGAVVEPPRRATAPPMSLKELAFLLWQEASLCRWHHSWQRDWGRTRYELIEAARRLDINGVPLESILFAPRVYRPSSSMQHNAEWDRFIDGVINRQPAGALLIAPVRNYYGSERYGASIRLGHMRQPIALTERCNGFLNTYCKTGLRQAQENANAMAPSSASAHRPGRTGPYPNPEIIGFFLVEPHHTGKLLAKSGWLMPVHRQSFIPAYGKLQNMLVHTLISKGYSFERQLSTDPQSYATSPDWIVRHVMDPRGVAVPRAALTIISQMEHPEIQQARANLASRLADKGIPTWYWSPIWLSQDESVPPLPPPDSLDAQTTHAVLEPLLQRIDCDYSYGPSKRVLLHSN